MAAANRAPGTASLVGRVVAGVLAAGAGVLFVLSAVALLGSRFGAEDRDPHGYGLIFGALLAVVSGFVVAALLPLALPRGGAGRSYAVSMAVFGVVFCVVVALVLTA